MKFFDIFSKEDSAVHSRLYHKFKVEFREMQISEEQIIKYTCISGLFARVCYADLEVKASEVEHIRGALNEWIDMPEDIVEWIARTSINEVVDLAGTENHLYIKPLFDLTTVEERFELLKALFAVSASDGETCIDETEEIRLICTGLRLDNRYFTAAKATVVDYLKALKKH